MPKTMTLIKVKLTLLKFINIDFVMSVPIEAGGVATRDVTSSVSRRAVVGRVGRGARFRRPSCIAGDAQISGRISEMFVTPVQGLSLSVVRGTVPFEESAFVECEDEQ